MTVATRDAVVAPHSLDAEKAVLGALMAHGDRWPDAATIVTDGDFFRSAHQTIYRAMRQLVDDRVAVDFLTVKELLARRGEVDEVGGPAYLAALSDGVPRSANVGHYAGIVRDLARLRDVMRVGQRLIDDASESHMPADVVIEAGTRALLALSTPAANDATRLDQAVGDYITGLDRNRSEEVTPTGFADVDELLAGGLRHAELTTVAGRPGTGKTALALTSAIHMGQKSLPTVVFSREMSTEALASRAASGFAKINAHRLASRMLKQDEFARLSAAWAALEGFPVLIQDTAATLTQLAAWCQRLKARPEGLRVVMLDYLQLLVPEGQRERSRQEEVSVITRGLKRLAKDYDVAVLALAQLSRAPELRTDKRPHLSDLRESGEIEQTSDVVMLLHRPEMYKPSDENQGIAEVIVAKNRNGPTGVVKLAFLKEYMRFEDLAR